jgi:putative hemolysin
MPFLLLFSLILSFLLSGMESALLSVSRVRVRHAADDDDSVAARMLLLLEDREGLLGAVTVANHLANLSAFGLIAWSLVQQIGLWGYGIAFVLALPVFIVVLEMLPKTLFRRFPYRALRRLMPLLSMVAFFRWPFRAMSRLPAITDKPHQEPQLTNRDDLKQLINSIAEQRLLPVSAAQLILSVLDLSKLTAATVMVPMKDLMAVSGEVPVSTALRLAQQHDFTSLPVLSEQAGGGYVGVFDATTLPANLPGDRLVRQHMRPMEEVESGMPALTVLQRLRRRGANLALVLDTNASSRPALGIVTEQDLISSLLPKYKSPASC